MTRPPRIQLAGGHYNVTQRGNARLAIFFDDEDRKFFRAILGLTARRQRWVIHAYCLMTNHFHLVIETPEPNLSAGMQRLTGIYAQWFNERHTRSGHVFQGRFGSRLIESDAYLAAACDYAWENPVRAGLCGRADEWPWNGGRGFSSHGRGLTPDVAL